MIVDTHTHLDALAGPRERNIYGVKTSDLDEYLHGFRLNHVDACWVFPIVSLRSDAFVRQENEALAAARQQHPRRLYPFGTVWPVWPEDKLRREIRYAIEGLKLHGLKFIPICQGGVSLADAKMDIVAEEAIRLSVPVFFHDGSPQYCSAIQVAYYARKHPELRVVSGHGGLRELWPDVVDAAGELPNLHVCLSGPTQWGLQRLYDELGPEKLMFGSDGGIGAPAVTTAYLRRIDRLRAPPEHKEMILGANAMRLLFGERWKDKRPGSDPPG